MASNHNMVNSQVMVNSQFKLSSQGTDNNQDTGNSNNQDMDNSNNQVTDNSPSMANNSNSNNRRKSAIATAVTLCNGLTKTTTQDQMPLLAISATEISTWHTGIIIASIASATIVNNVVHQD